MDKMRSAVRPVVTVLFVATFCALGLIWGIGEGDPEQIKEAAAFVGAPTGGVVGYWFASRQSERQRDQDDPNRIQV